MARIASLVPSLTELVIALGLGDHVVARTGFCVHPADAVRRIPKVGGTKDVDLEKLRAARPSHVLVNVDENRLETIEAIRAWPARERPELIVTHPLAPRDNLALIDQLVQAFGELPGVRAKAAALRDEFEREFQLTRAGEHAPQQVLYLIWREPWMTVARDTYISRMLACVNWRTLPEAVGGHHGAARYPVLRGDEPWLAQVQQVLLSSEPYRFTEAHLDSARQLCPQARARLIDGELVSWYGPRAAAGLRYLRSIAG
ncbi:MAG TPA: helical backbone metal receptor [Albitalea sp.]|nr:helical backbone metal receptor [Albitalea sp.]